MIANSSTIEECSNLIKKTNFTLKNINSTKYFSLLYKIKNTIRQKVLGFNFYNQTIYASPKNNDNEVNSYRSNSNPEQNNNKNINISSIAKNNSNKVSSNNAPHNYEEKKNQLYKNVFTAGISSSISRTVICPLERVEIFRQLSTPEFKKISIHKSLMKIYNQQGFWGLFKGNSAAVIRIFPFSAIEFYSMEFYKNIFLRGEANQHRARSKKYIFLCGVLTAFNAITCTYPLDVVRTRMASNLTDKCVSETRLLHCLIKLYQTQGIRGLYKGYYICFFGAVPFIAIKQTLYEILHLTYMNPNYTSTLNFLYGALSSLIGTTLLYPSYMLKRILHVNSKLYLVIIIIIFSYLIRWFEFFSN